MGSNNLTYRVWGLPSNASASDSENILSAICDTDGQKTMPKVHSIGLDPYELGSNVPKVATVTFAHTPIPLRDGEEWTFPTQESEISIRIDTRFLGFTPLNAMENGEEPDVE
jgi:hypothetical protein